MARSGAVLAGLRAGQAAKTPAVQPLGGSASPLVAQYGQWTLGRTTQDIAQPRDPIEFLTGAFGPLAPIQPIGIDTPPDDAERPEPRRWQYPVGWNMPMGMPGTEGLKLADFQVLRTYAELYSVARACIQLRKDEMLGVGWDVGPTADAAKAMRGDHAAMTDFGERRAEAIKFFKKPDPNYADFTSWFDAVLEDVFVIDALSLYLHPSRLKGKGLFGSELAGIDLIDGSLVRPLLDLRGGSPAPPNPAYQIYNYGVPRVDMMSMLTGDDVKDMPAPKTQYRGDQLLYLPRNPRSWTPYGQAPMERCVIPMLTGLRKQQWQMDFYQEGSIPAVYISPGDVNLTPNQIREVQDSLNAIAGDVAYKHKVIMLPANSRVDPQKPPELADQSDEIIMTQVCMAYSVMPMELGISPRVSATQSNGAANQMAKASQDIHERKALKPDLLWLKKALFDRILQDICGQEDMEWKWDGLEEDEDEETLTSLLVQQIGGALASIDEARIELGRQPWGLPITSDPGWATATGFVPLGVIGPDGQPLGDTPNAALSGTPQGGAPPPGTPPAPALPPAPAQPQQRPATPPAVPNVPNVGPGTPKPALPPVRSPGSNAGQSPAHDGAEASGARSQKPRPAAKAVQSELDMLARHLNKGRALDTWSPRYLDPETLEAVRAELASGSSPEDAVCKVGAEGYIHGYVCVRPPCGKAGDLVSHPVHGDGAIVRVDHAGAHAAFEDGTAGILGKPDVLHSHRRTSRHVAQHARPRHAPETPAEVPDADIAEIVNLPPPIHMPDPPPHMTQGQAIEHVSRVLLLDHMQHAQVLDAHEQRMAAHESAFQRLKDELKAAERKAREAESQDARMRAIFHIGTILGGAALGTAVAATGGGLIVAAIASLAPQISIEVIDWIKKW